MATMLMVVVVVFFVCNVLALVVNILEVMSINVIALNNTSNLLVTFNSSVNIVIYCIFGDKFKRIFFTMFCPPFIKRRSGGREFMTRYPAADTRELTAAGGRLHTCNGGGRTTFRQVHHHMNNGEVPAATASSTHRGIEDAYEANAAEDRRHQGAGHQSSLIPSNHNRGARSPYDDEDYSSLEDEEEHPQRVGLLKETLFSFGKLPFVLAMRNRREKKLSTASLALSPVVVPSINCINKSSATQTPPLRSRLLGRCGPYPEAKEQCNRTQHHQMFVPGSKHDITITVSVPIHLPSRSLS